MRQLVLQIPQLFFLFHEVQEFCLGNLAILVGIHELKQTANDDKGDSPPINSISQQCFCRRHAASPHGSFAPEIARKYS
jgi:hypothetical protein